MDDRTVRARALGDECVALLREHEAEQHDDDERRMAEAVNLIAYLCHRVGLGFSRTGDDPLEAFRELVERTNDYQAVHHEHHL